MSLYDDLLDLFAANRTDEITAENGKLLRNKFNSRSVEELNTKPEYKAYYDIVRDAKKALEITLDSCNGNTTQEINKLISQIQSLKEFGRNQVSKTLLELIKKSIYRHWTENDRRLFDRKYALVIDWQHFFLSYTNRDYYATYNSFKNLIDNNLAPSVRREALSAKANVLARLLTQLLEQAGMRGFFDAKAIKSGDDIQDEIRRHCKTAYAFIQLVEHATFAEPSDGQKNWCFEEYNEFTSESEMLDLSGCAHDKRYHFVITVDEIGNLIPQFCNRGYNDWIAHARRLHVKSIEDGRRLEALRKSIKEIASEVKTLRDVVVFNTLQR